MIPIAINENQKFDYKSFKEYLVCICKEHRYAGRALAFAFIVYDFEDYTITEILQKKNYWTSLDKISGKTLSIFYINSNDSYYNKRQEEIYQEELKQFDRSIKRGEMSYMVPVARGVTPVDNAIGIIKEGLGIEENIKTPFVLFFQVGKEDNISDSLLVNLKRDKLEDAFLELRDHIKNAVESLSEVLPENNRNHQEIFNLLKTGIKGGISGHSMRLGIEVIISFVKHISGYN